MHILERMRQERQLCKDVIFLAKTFKGFVFALFLLTPAPGLIEKRESSPRLTVGFLDVVGLDWSLKE